jgi:hypothetical protein
MSDDPDRADEFGDVEDDDAVDASDNEPNPDIEPDLPAPEPED